MYCRECGEKLTLRFCENEGLVPYCSKCESYMFPEFPIAVSMVVTNRAQDKILLAKHVEDDDFILFAGYVKKGENVEKTIPREIREELSLDVVKAKYMSSRYHARKDVLMLNFIVVVEEKPFKLAEAEIAEARWCSPEEALKLVSNQKSPKRRGFLFIRTKSEHWGKTDTEQMGLRKKSLRKKFRNDFFYYHIFCC